MKLITRANLFFSHYIWNPLPAVAQASISQLWSIFYKTRLSRFLIRIFVNRYGMDSNEMSRYQSRTGHFKYNSFQDFLPVNLSIRRRKLDHHSGLVRDLFVIMDMRLHTPYLM